jgi:hypothetical protein
MTSRMVSRGSRALTALLVATTLFGADAAHADPSSGEKEAARKQMIRGLEQRKNGSTVEALESFRAADAIMHVPTTALEVARTQLALGHWLDARETATAALHAPARPGESAPFKEARAQMTALVDEVTARLPSVVITVTGAPPGTPTTVTLDGRDLPPDGFEALHKVDPGHHVIDGKAGETVGHVEVDVAEGRTEQVELVMRGGTLAAPAPADQVVGAPAKKIDGLQVAEIAGFAAGGVGLVTGVVTGLVSISKTSSIKSACGGDNCPLDTYNSLHDDRVVAHTTANIATAGFILAGVGVAVGVTAFVLRSHKKTEANAAPQASWMLAPGIFAGTF